MLTGLSFDTVVDNGKGLKIQSWNFSSPYTSVYAHFCGYTSKRTGSLCVRTGYMESFEEKVFAIATVLWLKRLETNSPFALDAIVLGKSCYGCCFVLAADLRIAC